MLYYEMVYSFNDFPHQIRRIARYFPDTMCFNRTFKKRPNFYPKSEMQLTALVRENTFSNFELFGQIQLFLFA
jgi:hypothetical protein